jgi:hypothetical protein
MNVSTPSISDLELKIKIIKKIRKQEKAAARRGRNAPDLWHVYDLNLYFLRRRREEGVQMVR